MNKIERTRNKEFSPFRFANNQIEVEIHGVKLDGKDLDDRFLRKDDRLTMLEDHEFEKAKFECRIKLDKSNLEDKLPNFEDLDSATEAVLLLRSSDSRKRNLLFRGDLTKEEYEFEIELNRNDFRGKVELTPKVVRTRACEVDGDYASKKGQVIADGNEHTVRFDKDEEVATDYLLSKWRDFEELNKDVHKHMMYFLDFSEPENPILYLNETSEMLKSVYNSKASNNLDARLRDVFIDAVYQPVWYNLIRFAMADYDPKKEDFFPYDWEKNIMERMIPKIFTSDLDFETGLKRLNEQLNDEDSVKRTLHDINKSIQLKRIIPNDMEKLIKKSKEQNNEVSN